MSLATKYRPTDFSEVCGNKLTVEILKRSIETKNFKNVMLFYGNTGSGKTTLARIVANKINGTLDGLIEIDAAANNGVDQIRAIIASAKERSLVGEYKIILMDECHMLTQSSWNALLKLLEECPKYTILMFCTTDPQKIPQTVANRMQRYSISKIPAEEITSRLIQICKAENYTNYEQACDLIAKQSNGSMREAITTLEKCANFSTDLNINSIKAILGESSYETMFKLTWALTNKDEKEIFNSIDHVDSSDQGLRHFIDVYIEFILDLTKYILFNDINLTSLPAYLDTEENPVVKFTTSIADNLSIFNALVETLLDIKTRIKYDVSCKVTIIASFIKFIRS